MQQKYNDLRSSWKHEDFSENIKAKDELDRFIRSTKMKISIQAENERMKKELEVPTDAEKLQFYEQNPGAIEHKIDSKVDKTRVF